MAPSDVFGIVVRSVGLVVLVMWVFTLWGAGFSGQFPLLVQAFITFLLGLYLLRGAPLIMKLAYGERSVRAVREELA